MSIMVNAFSEAIQNLADDTGGLLRKIVSCNNNLSAKLDNLGNSFTDEGIDIIKKHIAKTRNRISDAVPEFGVFLGKLTEYAKYLEKSQKVIGDAATGGSIQQESVPYTKPKWSEWVALHNKPEWDIHPNGSSTYGYPQETVEKLMLNCDQGELDARGYPSACNLVCGENMLRMAGQKGANVRAILEFCKSREDLRKITNERKGGATPEELVEILKAFRLPCKLEKPDINSIERAILSGKIVVLGIDALELSDGKFEGKHALTVISMERNAKRNLTHFYVVDPDRRYGLTKYTKEKIKNSLIEEIEMVVTKDKVRFFNNEHNI